MRPPAPFPYFTVFPRRFVFSRQMRAAPLLPALNAFHADKVRPRVLEAAAPRSPARGCLGAAGDARHCETAAGPGPGARVPWFEPHPTLPRFSNFSTSAPSSKMTTRLALPFGCTTFGCTIRLHFGRLRPTSALHFDCSSAAPAALGWPSAALRRHFGKGPRLLVALEGEARHPDEGDEEGESGRTPVQPGAARGAARCAARCRRAWAGFRGLGPPGRQARQARQARAPEGWGRLTGRVTARYISQGQAGEVFTKIFMLSASRSGHSAVQWKWW